MSKDKIITIVFNERIDRLQADTQCPICGDKYSQHIPYVQLGCGKCSSTYRTDFKQRAFTKKAADIIKADSWNNIVKYEFSEKYEEDLVYIQKLFVMKRSYRVGDIKKKIEEYRRCEKCGVCLNCLTCKKCGKTFEKDKHRKKHICPHCKGNTYTPTYIKEIIVSEENENIKLCSHCKSDRVFMTKSKTKSKCHLCGSKKLSDKKVETTLYLTIQRKRAYKL